MSRHKLTNVFCALITAFVLVFTVVLGALGQSSDKGTKKTSMPYEEKLFSTEMVHTVEIIANKTDWENMLENAINEEYIQCAAVIDGEAVKNIAIRPKGNSSLSMIAGSDSDRYSFKIDFSHYDKGKTFYGLDLLALNNIAQDNTYMKDYVSYQMMNAMGAYAPLSSFAWVKVNGEGWGLYVLAEGISKSFAQRVYGNSYQMIYKPESTGMGNMGNRGQGGGGQGMRDFGDMPDFGNMPNFGDMPDFANMPDFDNMPAFNGRDQNGGMDPGMGGFGGGNSAVSLVYSGEDMESYSAIFDNSVFKVSKADKTRLVDSLKKLGEGGDLEGTVDIDEVMRYFAVHNFVLNSDSYTGNLIHNYYLSEIDGKLSMIAWDYNLAFGGMGMMGGGSDGNAASLVNYPIDSPMLSGSIEDRPMIAWIFSDESYLDKYHEILSEYMGYFASGAFTDMYDNAISLISSYVESDPSAFCTYDEFLDGSAALKEFCLLRAESISYQLGGKIASTKEAQASSNNEGFVDASEVDIQSMGSSSMGFNRARDGQFPNFGDQAQAMRPPDMGGQGMPAFGNFDNANQATANNPTSPIALAYILSACGVLLIGALYARKPLM